ncbi:MAG TPA: hypothetical protein VGH89_42715, partial [Pseudonocardia sp.]
MSDDGAGAGGGAVATAEAAPVDVPPTEAGVAPPVGIAGQHRHATLVVAGPAVKLTAIHVRTRPPLLDTELERHPLAATGWGLPLAVLVVGMFMSVLDT